jgi:hypothetical protein
LLHENDNYYNIVIKISFIINKNVLKAKLRAFQEINYLFCGVGRKARPTTATGEDTPKFARAVGSPARNFSPFHKKIWDIFYLEIPNVLTKRKYGG